MIKILKLNPRLMLCASMVDFGTKKVVDVGTDHAYLPIYLVQKGTAKSALVLDRLDGPLGNAKKNIKKYEVENLVKTRLSNGLSNVSEKEADTVIIAGMGAENIINILRNTNWIKSNKKTLILQPMTKDYLLRTYLIDNSFITLKEELATESKKVYLVLKVKHQSCVKESNKNIYNKIDPSIYPYIGTLFLNKKINEEKNFYIKSQINKIEKMLKGAVASKNIIKSESLLAIKNKIDILLNFYKEY